MPCQPKKSLMKENKQLTFSDLENNRKTIKLQGKDTANNLSLLKDKENRFLISDCDKVII
jgi:hypothetical protein